MLLSYTPNCWTAAKQKSNCRWWLKSLAALHGRFCLFWRIFRTYTVYINAFYTISCDVPFNVQACQMTPRTEEPSHNRWQRLKLACPRFVHYDEQIMFLHVYWLFCQMVHQAFQDHTEWMRCLMETVKGNKQYSRCESRFSATNGTVVTVEPPSRTMCQHNVTVSAPSINAIFHTVCLFSRHVLLWALHHVMRKIHWGLINFNFNFDLKRIFVQLTLVLMNILNWPTVTTVINGPVSSCRHQKGFEEKKQLNDVGRSKLGFKCQFTYSHFFIIFSTCMLLTKNRQKRWGNIEIGCAGKAESKMRKKKDSLCWENKILRVKHELSYI